MTISVAMCTYNGARYIREQLESILCQTRSVDEIVICDDGSTDETLDIIKDTTQSSAVTVRLIRNIENLGYFKNFLQAISLCTGDIVFLSDQDDFWREDKVEKISKWFETHKDKNVVFTNAKLIDEHSIEFTEDTLWDRVGFNTKMQKYFNKGYGQEVFTLSNRATGATMTIRKTFLCNKDLLSYNFEIHDYAIAYLSVIEDSCGFINETLTSYRIHKGQTIGVDYYAPCHYSPLKAFSGELNVVQNLPENAMRRLEFMKQREQFYIHHSLCGMRMRAYVRQYGRWWYRFFAYDIYRSLKHDWILFKMKIRNRKDEL